MKLEGEPTQPGIYIHQGKKWWEGSKDDILHADNQELNDFVFASAMAKRAKQSL
jgi:phospholipid/cholesterol/gamma-HCH transport system ATP-binding protein